MGIGGTCAARIAICLVDNSSAEGSLGIEGTATGIKGARMGIVGTRTGIEGTPTRGNCLKSKADFAIDS
jgi:hypothetical protein